MYGALIASIINGEYKDDSYLNVETIMTVAVAEALLRVEELKEENKHVLFTCDPVPQWMKEEINNSICKWSDEFHMDPQTLRSSSGIALVASAGWLASSVEEARRMAKLIMRYKQPKTDVQSYFLPLQCQDPNNTPVSAEILASIIFFARNNIENEYIKSYILQEINCAYPDAYLYDIQKALTCFKGENSFEAIVKKAAIRETDLRRKHLEMLLALHNRQILQSDGLEGKTDSIIAIVGSLAEAYYGIRLRLKLVGKNMIPKDIQSILDKI